MRRPGSIREKAPRRPADLQLGAAERRRAPRVAGRGARTNTAPALRPAISRPRHWTADWLGYLPAVGATLFAVTYGILRPAYDRFYEPLGLSVDDLGISETRIVGHAAGYAAALALVIGAAVTAGRLTYLGTQSVVRMVNENQWPDRLLTLYADWLRRLYSRYGMRTLVVLAAVSSLVPMAIVLYLLLIVVTIVAAFAAEQEEAIHGTAEAVLSIAAIGVVVGFLLSLAIGTLAGSGSTAARLVRAAIRISVAMLLTGLAMAAATAALDFWVDARQLSVDIITGRGTSDALHVMDWLDVRPTPVTLHLVTDNDPVGLCDGRSIAYLLGYHESFIYLLLYPEDGGGVPGRTVRVGDSAYAVSGGLENSTPCRRA